MLAMQRDQQARLKAYQGAAADKDRRKTDDRAGREAARIKERDERLKADSKRGLTRYACATTCCVNLNEWCMGCQGSSEHTPCGGELYEWVSTMLLRLFLFSALLGGATAVSDWPCRADDKKDHHLAVASVSGPAMAAETWSTSPCSTGRHPTCSCFVPRRSSCSLQASV